MYRSLDGDGQGFAQTEEHLGLPPVSLLRLARKDCLPMGKVQKKKGQKGHIITNHGGLLLPLTSLSGDLGLKQGPSFPCPSSITKVSP